MHRRVLMFLAVALASIAGCGDPAATSPTTFDRPRGPVEIQLTGRAPVTPPGSAIQLRMLDAPLWLYPVCPAGPDAIACGPEGPGVLLEAVVDGQRLTFDVFTTGRTTSRVHGYDVTLLRIEPESPLRRGEIDQAVAQVRVSRSVSAVP